MADQKVGRIAIDDIIESTATGVLRALEARRIAGPEFTKQNGFFVKIDITAGGYPFPIDKFGGQLGPQGASG